MLKHLLNRQPRPLRYSNPSPSGGDLATRRRCEYSRLARAVWSEARYAKEVSRRAAPRHATPRRVGSTLSGLGPGPEAWGMGMAWVSSAPIPRRLAPSRIHSPPRVSSLTFLGCGCRGLRSNQKLVQRSRNRLEAAQKQPRIDSRSAAGARKPAEASLGASAGAL